MQRRLCSIAARNYLPAVELLVETFQAHHPDIAVSVLLVDGSPDETYCDLPFEVLFPSALPLPDDEFRRMATYYDVTELSTAVKPFLLEALLDRGDDVVMYLDPDIEVFAPLEDLFEQAAIAGIVLTPHVMQPVPRDGLVFAEESLLLSGHFNLGFVAVSQESRAFLDYWKERTLRYAVIEIGAGYFTDQRWVDAVPSLFPHAVVRDAGCNVAYWNLHERDLRYTDDGWRVNEVPLRFFHFSGHDAETPFVLSRHLGGVSRVRVDEQPALRDLLKNRAASLASRDAGTPRLPYGYERTESGLRLDAVIRRLYWRAVIRADASGDAPPPHAFVDGGQPFREWLREPVGERGLVSRHLLAIWESRPDLQHAFPEPTGADAERFLDWAEHDDCNRTHGASIVTTRGSSFALPGVNLVGYLEGEFGVGAAARMMADTVRATGLPLATSVLGADGYRHDATFISGVPGTPFSLTLLAMNADALIHYARANDLRALAGTRRVGIWYWEVDVLPPELHGAFRLVDEVWCASDYVRSALEPYADVPVRVHPVAFPAHVPTGLERRDLDLPDDRFLFGFAFDYASVVKRKNPAGVIDAYQRAFAPDDGAALVLKSVYSLRACDQAAELRHLARDREDIIFVDGHYDEIEMAAFYEHLDAYVSLHRSEGLGLTMSTAMAAGVPVVATGWSGNLSFMAEGDALLVPYELVPVGPDAAPYPSTAQWAEPDLDAAAQHLRTLFDDPAAARVLGRQGQAAITRAGDRTRVASWFKARFEALTGVAAA